MACKCASGGSMASTNVIIADLSRTRTVRVKTLYQYNYGMKLKFTGIDDLPTSYEVHFANDIEGTSTTHIADETGVVIPRQYFIPGETIYAWLYLHPAEGSGVTDGLAVMPISPRAAIDESEPTEEEKSAIEEAIEALNNAIDTPTEKANAAEAAKIASEAAQAAAEESAGSAAQSATAAEESATAASESATEAEKNARKTQRFGMATEEMKNDAERARDAALLNAQNASTSANEAAGYAERAERAAIHEPRIVAGYWCVWNPVEQVYQNSGVPATGDSKLGLIVKDGMLNAVYLKEVS